jgi:hypothetical protein
VIFSNPVISTNKTAIGGRSVGTSWSVCRKPPTKSGNQPAVHPMPRPASVLCNSPLASPRVSSHLMELTSLSKKSADGGDVERFGGDPTASRRRYARREPPNVVLSSATAGAALWPLGPPQNMMPLSAVARRLVLLELDNGHVGMDLIVLQLEFSSECVSHRIWSFCGCSSLSLPSEAPVGLAFEYRNQHSLLASSSDICSLRFQQNNFSIL